MIRYCFFFLFLIINIRLFPQNQLPYILDMVHNNPGEKPYETKYNDPYFLKHKGLMVR